jgi:hypothetical protein
MTTSRDLYSRCNRNRYCPISLQTLMNKRSLDDTEILDVISPLASAFICSALRLPPQPSSRFSPPPATPWFTSTPKRPPSLTETSKCFTPPPPPPCKLPPSQRLARRRPGLDAPPQAENVLQGSDGKWKICDMGSCVTRARAYENKSEISREEVHAAAFCLLALPFCCA